MTGAGQNSDGARARARLEDVARMAGVSVPTASRALNGGGRMAEDTRVRVRQAAEALGYRAHAVARALSLNRSMTAGLIVPDIGNSYFAPLARGVAEGLAAGGYHYLLADTGNTAVGEHVAADLLAGRGVDGFITASSLDLAYLRSKMVPVVAVSRCDGVPYSASDNVLGGRLAAQHLIAAGYRRLAVVHYNQFEHGGAAVPDSQDRYDGFREVVREAGLEWDACLDRRMTHISYANGYAVGQELALAGADGVFAVDDFVAIGVVAGLLDAGRSVPDDVGVIGYDDTPIASWNAPIPLTTIASSPEVLGFEAARIFLELVGDPSAKPASFVLAPRLVVRRSTRAVSARARRRGPVTRPA